MLKKNKKLLVGALAVVAVSALTLNFKAAVSALEPVWGPVDRPTYTLENPANEPVFNSITNNHNTTENTTDYFGTGVSGLDTTVDHTQSGATSDTPSSEIGLGDERNFVRIRKAGTNDIYSDVVEAVPGEEYEVYVYYHNNARPDLGSAGYAYNVALRMESPEKLNAGQTAVIKGYISWNKEANNPNAEKFSVWDSTFLKASETLYLRYVPNSAVLHNGNTSATSANGTILNAEALWGNGAFLGYDIQTLSTGQNTWGVIPGCNNYAGYVTFRLKADQPKFYLEKEVSADGETNWTDTIEAAPGDTLHFRIHYKNIGTTLQEKVKASDVLADEMLYDTIENTEDATKNFAVLWTSGVIGETPAIEKQTMKVNPEEFFGNAGTVIGDYGPNTEFYIYYDVKLADADKFEKCLTNIWNKGHIATANGSMNDSVKVTVIKDCGELPNTGLNGGIMIVSITLGCVVCITVGYVTRMAKNSK